MGLLAFSPEGRAQAGDKEAEQVLPHLENGTGGVSRAVAKHCFHFFVCFLGGLGKVHGHPQAAAVTAIKKRASYIF